MTSHRIIGTVPDRVAAAALGLSTSGVRYHRYRLGRDACFRHYPTEWAHAVVAGWLREQDLPVSAVDLRRASGLCERRCRRILRELYLDGVALIVQHGGAGSPTLYVAAGVRRA